MSTFRRTRALVAALCLVLTALQCSDAEAPAGASVPSDTSATSSTPVEPNDSPFPDSLFQRYDDELLAALRPDRTGAEAWVDSLMNALSLEEKIAQLVIVDLKPEGPTAEVPQVALDAVQRHGVGGFLVSRILEPEQVYRQIQRLQRLADVPLFFAADYERGAGRFSNNFTELPSNMAIGAARMPGYAAGAGRLTAIESRAVGVNLLFTPVVDVNNNPDNPIINIRSYGGDPALVGRMAAAYVRAAEGFGALTTLKHFPGHGNTSTDTHAEMGVVTSSREELRRVELAPYRMVLEEAEVQPTGVMSAHLWMKAITDDPLPATFSEKALSGLLRDSLGFEGIVFTDDIKMGALQNDYSLSERVVRPMKVGADVVLTPENLPAAIRAVREAVASGTLSEQALDRSVRRVLEAKARAGLHNRRLPDRQTFEALLAEPRGQAMAQAIADEAVTILKTAPGLPLGEEGTSGMLLQLSNYKGAESIDAAMDTLAATLTPSVRDTFRMGRSPSQAARRRVLQAAQGAEQIILALHLRLQSGRGEAGLFEEQRRLVQRLIEQETPVTLVTFGNPYAVRTFPEADAFVVAYDQTIASVKAVAGVLKGEQAAPGRLPITVGSYDYGSGQAEWQ